MRIKLFLSAIAISTAISYGQNSMCQLIDTIVANNPDYRAFRLDSDAEINGLKSENTLRGIDADFEYKFHEKGNRWGLGVSQSFDWPGVYRLRKNAIKTRQLAAELQIRALRRQLGLDVKNRLINLHYLQEEAALLEAARSNVNQALELINRAYEKSEATILDLRKAQTLAFSMAAQVDQLQNNIEEAKSGIALLNGGVMPKIPVLRYDEDVLLPESSYLELLDSNDPEIAAKQALTNAAVSDIKVASAQALPGFSLGYVHDFEEEAHFNGFSVGIELPTWTNKYKKNQMVSIANSADVDFEKYRESRISQLRNNYLKATRLQTLLQNSGSIFDNSFIDLLTTAFNAGQINALTYFAEVNQFIEAKIEYLALQKEYALTLADLNSLTGEE